MVMDRILERPALTFRKTRAGHSPDLSQVKDIQRRSLGTASSPASFLERWMKRFNALGFTRGAFPRNRKPRFQTARAWLVGIIGMQRFVQLQGESRLRRLAL